MVTPYYIFPSFSESDKQFPIYVVTVGRESSPIETNRPDGIPNYQIHITISGEGEIVLDGKKIPLTKNSVMFLKPGTPQHYYPTEDWDVIWVTYNHNNFLDIPSLESGIYNVSSAEPLINILSLMLKGKGTLNFAKNASMLMYNFLLEFNEYTKHENYYETHSTISPAIKFIEQNYQSDFDTAHLANLCSISYEHFCRLFKNAYNLRPLEYIQKLRIQEAKRLLITFPDMSVEDVGKAVGYSSSSYFIRHFKRVENTTPLQFRHNYN